LRLVVSLAQEDRLLVMPQGGVAGCVGLGEGVDRGRWLLSDQRPSYPLEGSYIIVYRRLSIRRASERAISHDSQWKSLNEDHDRLRSRREASL
jgi:hypothetical protein